MIIQDPITQEIFNPNLYDDTLHFTIEDTDPTQILIKVKAIINILSINTTNWVESIPDIYEVCPLSKANSIFINDLLEAYIDDIEYTDPISLDHIYAKIFIRLYQKEIPVILE